MQVMVLITGANKSIALYKAIEEGVCHMWTVSAFQQHSNTLMVCDEVRSPKEQLAVESLCFAGDLLLKRQVAKIP